VSFYSKQGSLILSSKQNSLKAARIAISLIFLFHGTLMSSWAARIPTIQQQLHLDTGTLGFALWGAAAGAIAAFPLTGFLIARLGSRLTTMIGGLFFSASLVLPALAPNPLLLGLALVLFGAGTSMLDVAMNAQGSAVEEAYGRPIMSSFHGLWSTGSIVGASIGGIMAGLNIAPLPHFLAVAVILAVGVLIVSRWLLPIAPESNKQTPIFVRPTKALLGLGFIAFCAFMSEGAITDWSGVYLHSTLGTSTGIAAAGFAFYSLAMTVARLTGDRLTQLLGPVRQVQLSGFLAMLGLCLALLIPHPVVAIVGFCFVGIGLACVAPLAFSAAGRMPGVSPAVALAAVATVAYSGSLIGPPLIGHVAEIITLRGALGLAVLLSVGIVLLARTVGHAPLQQKQSEGQQIEQQELIS
jgi:MFS family permease